jgi:hypothetical protein
MSDVPDFIKGIFAFLGLPFGIVLLIGTLCSFDGTGWEAAVILGGIGLCLTILGVGFGIELTSGKAE